MERELETAIEAAQRAGAVVADIYRRRDYTVATKDDARKSELTEADLASNTIILDTLRAAFPRDAILSEETADDGTRLGNPRCWIVDPLDGTREFTMGLPEFCVSIGFVIDGKPVVGALFNPATGETIAGAVGRGLTCDGKPASVSSHATVPGAKFLVSRSEVEKGWFDHLKGQVDYTPMGSVAWKFGLVAVGRAEASFTPVPRNEWDLCGGAACIVAGGGRATDAAGVDYTFNRPDVLHRGVCGTNGHLHDAVLDLMRQRS